MKNIYFREEKHRTRRKSSRRNRNKVQSTKKKQKKHRKTKTKTGNLFGCSSSTLKCNNNKDTHCCKIHQKYSFTEETTRSKITTEQKNRAEQMCQGCKELFKLVKNFFFWWILLHLCTWYLKEP